MKTKLTATLLTIAVRDLDRLPASPKIILQSDSFELLQTPYGENGSDSVRQLMTRTDQTDQRRLKTMYELTTIAGLLNRVRRKAKPAVYAMAGLLLIAAASMPAKAQVANTYTGATVVHGGTIGLVPGQKLIVTVPNFYYQDGSVRFLKHTVKVYANVTENESGLVYSGESGGMAGHEFGHIFTIGRLDLPVPGDPNTGRVEISIVVESFPVTGGVRNAEVRPPTIELTDDSTGKTVAIALLLPAIQAVR